jgi:photosystem II stability/assembly factor-like uncharacterized protein
MRDLVFGSRNNYGGGAMKGILVKTNNEFRDEEYSWEAFAKYLNSYLEIVNIQRWGNEGYAMLVDDEGAIKDLGVNILASYLYGTDVRTDFNGPRIYGDAFIVRRNGPNLECLSEGDIKKMMKRLWGVLK